MIVLDDNVVSIQATDPASNPGFASTCIDGVVVSCHPPWASQICFCPLLQRVELGTQEPPHTPAEQRYWHAVPLCHAPFAVHVCGTLFAHWCAPGVHDIPHTRRSCRRTGTPCRTASRPPPCRSAGRCCCSSPDRACTGRNRHPGCTRRDMPDRSPRRRRRCTTAASPTSCTDARPDCRRPRSRPAGRRTCTPAPPATVPGRRRAQVCRRRSSRPDCRRRRSCRRCRCSCRWCRAASCRSRRRSAACSRRTGDRRACNPSRPDRPHRPSRRRPSGSTHQGCSSRRSPGLRSRRGHRSPPHPWCRPGPLPPFRPRPRDPEVPAVPAVPDAPASAPPIPGGVIVVDGVDRSARRRAHHRQQPSDAGKFGQPFRYHQAHR